MFICGFYSMGGISDDDSLTSRGLLYKYPVEEGESWSRGFCYYWNIDWNGINNSNKSTINKLQTKLNTRFQWISFYHMDLKKYT